MEKREKEWKRCMERDIVGDMYRDPTLQASALCWKRDIPEELHLLSDLCWNRHTSEGTVAQGQPMPKQGSSKNQGVV